MADMPNFAETYANALQTGQQIKQSRAKQNALALIGTDPAGAQTALMQAGDYQGANALSQMSEHQAALDTRAKVAPMVQSGDLEGAANTALAGGQMDLATHIEQMGKDKRERAAATASAFATTAYGLGQIPLDQGPDPLASRKAALAKVASHLQELGVSPDVLAKADLSDQGLKTVAMQALSVKDMIAQQQQKDQLAETKDYHDKSLKHEDAVLGETKTHNRADERAAMARAAGEGWQTLTDPGNGNQPFRYNARTGQATTLDGSAAYAPKSAAKLGSDSVRSPAMAALVKWKEENPNATADQIAEFGSKLKAQAKATTDFGTGKQGDAVRRINVSLSHLDTLAELGLALDNGNIQLLNKAKNDFQQAFGVAAPTNFDAAKQFVMNEVTAATLGGQGGVGDREKTNNAVSRASSQKQLAGVIKNTVQPLLAGQLHGLKQQYKTSTGLDNFETLLSPETVAKLETTPPAAAGGVVHYDAQGNRIK